MALPNNAPIYSRQADVDGSSVFTTAAADYTGQGANNSIIFKADTTNGGFVQRLRFKALGTNVATVARIYINNGFLRSATSLAAVVGTPTGTPSTTGGTLQAGNYFAKIYAVDQWGGTTAASTESAAVAVTGTTGSIAWAWAAVTGAVSYIITVGPVTGQQITQFTSTTNSYSQTIPGSPGFEGDFTANNNYFYGEVTLPATTAIATASTVDIDYPMNFPLMPGQNIVVGLGTTVAAGWVITTIAGSY
jgi:hypothetical protein